MEKLLDHTLQRQMLEQNEKINELTQLVKQMEIHSSTAPVIQNINAPSTVNNAPVTNTTIVVNAWDEALNGAAQQLTYLAENFGEILNALAIARFVEAC